MTLPRLQVLSGNIPTEIAEGPEGSDTPPAPAAVSVGLDVPKRRTSVAGVFPVAASSPHNSARSMGSRSVRVFPAVPYRGGAFLALSAFSSKTGLSVPLTGRVPFREERL